MKKILLTLALVVSSLNSTQVLSKGFDIDSMKKGAGTLLNKNYFISTSLSSEQIGKGLHSKICSEMASFIHHFNKEKPYITCTSYNKDEKVSMKGAFLKQSKLKDKTTPEYKYHYHIQELTKKKFEFRVVNNDIRDNDVDFKRSSYYIKYESEEKIINEFKKSAFISLDYDKRNLQAKMIFVKATLEAEDSEYELVKAAQQSGAIIAHKKSKIRYGVMKYYDMLKNDDKKRNYLRAILEVVGIYGFAGASYIAQMDTPSISAGFHYEWSDVFNYKKRVRFDDEGPGYNWGHTLAGMLVHTIFRSNNFTRLESFMATLFVSTAWENFFEFREVWSINDQIFTIGAGSSMAIATEVLCDKLMGTHRGNKIIGNVLAFIHNPFCAINRFQDGKRDIPLFDKDEMSSVDILSRISYNSTTGKSSLGIEVKFDIVDLPIYGAGKVKKLLLNPRIAQVEILGTANTVGLDEIRGFTQVALAAYHIKNQELDANQLLTGYSFVFSLTTGTEFHSRASDKNEDWFGVANVLGGKIELFYFFKGIKFRMGVNVSGDIAMGRSYGYRRFVKDNGIPGGTPQDILLQTEADFFWGHTNQGNVSVSGNIKGAYGGTWEIGGSLSNTSLKSIESLQRNADDIDNVVTLKENIGKFKVYFSYGPNAFKDLTLKLTYEELYRKGDVFSTLDNIFASDEGTQRQVTFSVIYNYL